MSVSVIFSIHLDIPLLFVPFLKQSMDCFGGFGIESAGTITSMGNDYPEAPTRVNSHTLF